MANLPPEEWRPVVGWEGDYEVSNLGKVRSLPRVLPLKNGTTRRYRGRELSLCLTSTGYPMVGLWRCTKVQQAKVHRLVAQAFIPNPEGLPDVNHLDGDKLNARASNLEWCTRQRNIAHAYETGLIDPSYKSGEGNVNSKLTADLVRQLRAERAAGAKTTALARKYGINTTTVSAICLRQRWKHIE